jgi:hypothetical protein
MFKPDDLEYGRQQIEIVKKHFEELGWSPRDVKLGLGWFTHVMLILIMNDMPMRTPKFPEILRALANVLELNRDEFSRRDKDHD